MNILSRFALIAATMLLMIPAIGPSAARAQTPAQMEYERQQREYARQQEQQRQEQQRQQQLMNENARRQQEESKRLNAPMGQSAAPAYPGAPVQWLRGNREPGPTRMWLLQRRSGWNAVA